MKPKVAILGLGMMGRAHLKIYLERDDVEVVALADSNPKRLHGEESAEGNIKGQTGDEVDLSQYRRYTDAFELIEKEAVDIIDVCLPTNLHLTVALAALKAKRNVLVEKPLCRTATEAKELLQAAAERPGIIMPGMCIRFWPGWDTLREAIADGRYGKLLSLSIQRLASHPGGAFYSDGAACGGALLDLHIHDTDFVYACLGHPSSVRTVGYRKTTGNWDHVSTQYVFENDILVTAEGGWTMAPGFPFTMRYIANFDEATVVYDLAAGSVLNVYRTNGTAEAVDFGPDQGYAREIDYFLNCLKSGRQPEVVTLEDGLASLRIFEAELESLESGNEVRV